jgi:hypothetical protein
MAKAAPTGLLRLVKTAAAIAHHAAAAHAAAETAHEAVLREPYGGAGWCGRLCRSGKTG